MDQDDPSVHRLAPTTFKYGVVSVNAMCDDLVNWRHMFVAGRMQKPVVALGGAIGPAGDGGAIDKRPVRARRRAPPLRRGVLPRGPPRATLCGLSYAGDVRVALGAEDVDKVRRIATGSERGLMEMYRDAVKVVGSDLAGLTMGRGGEVWSRDGSPAARSALFATLPRETLQKTMVIHLPPDLLRVERGTPIGEVGGVRLPDTDDMRRSPRACWSSSRTRGVDPRWSR